MKRRQQLTGPSRPQPPAEFLEVHFDMRFAPAPDLEQWALETFVRDTGRLHNPDHQHLLDADIGWLWASQGYISKGRRVLGLTEELRIMANPWAKGRQEQQFRDWFGGTVPAFVITLDADFCAQADDASFCALVEHELYHVGHRTNEYGVPLFDKDGQPRLFLRGHDVEEFIGVVRRYGVGSPDSALGQMILAAAKGPEVAPLKIAQACGTCLLRAA